MTSRKKTETAAPAQATFEQTQPPKTRPFRLFISITIGLLILGVFITPFLFQDQTQVILKPFLEKTLRLTPYPEEIKNLQQQQQKLRNLWQQELAVQQKHIQTLQDQLLQLQTRDDTPTAIDTETLQLIVQNNNQMQGRFLLHLNTQILKSAIYQGQTYPSSLETLSLLAKNYHPALTPLLASFIPYKDTGVLSTLDLLSSFANLDLCRNRNQTANLSTQGDALQKTEENLEESWSASWTQFFEQAFANLITVSPISEETNTLDNTAFQHLDSGTNVDLDSCEQWQMTIRQALKKDNLVLAQHQAKTPPDTFVSTFPAVWLTKLSQTLDMRTDLEHLFEALPPISTPPH